MTALEAGEGEGFENSRSLTGARPRRLFRPAENQSAESPARGRDAFLDCWISCEGWSRDTLRFVVDVASWNATSASIGCEAPAAAALLAALPCI